jgi:ADP-heptose:LPS heptosyltransferase
MTRRVMVIRAGALGDTLLAMPAVRALRRRYPDASLVAIGRREYWSLDSTLTDEIWEFDDPRLAPLLGPDPCRWEAIRDVDLAVGWTARDLSENLRTAGAAWVIRASPYPPPGVHAARWLMQTIGEGDEPLECSLPVIRNERGRETIVHPGAGALWKRWPAERFARLADLLKERGHEVVLHGGPADEEAMAAVLAASRYQHRVVAGTPLRDLPALLGRSHLYIGNDSGITHLAAMAGARVIALFGPTDPVQWSPLGRVTVLRRCVEHAQRQGEIRVCRDPACLEAIGVEEVLDAVERAGG